MSFIAGVIFRATIVFSIGMVLSFALRRASASARHGVWVTVMLSALVLPLASTILPETNLLLFQDAGIPRHASPAATASAVTPMSYAPATRLPSTPTETEAAARQSLVSTRSLSTTGWSWQRWVVLAWGLGFALVLTQLILGIAKLRRLTNASSSRIVDEEWQSLLAELKSQFSLARPVRLVMGSGSMPPMTWGLWRSVIFLPSHANQWAEERRRFVLAHELAHVKRGDGVLQVLVQFICAMYWFHPLAWYAAGRLRLEREHACDDRVLNLGADADDYASHLLQVARAISPNGGYGLAAMSMVSSSQLERRLRAIIGPRRNRNPLSRNATSLLFWSSALTTLLIASLHLTALASSRRSMAEALDLAQRNNVTVYAISTNKNSALGSQVQSPGDKTLETLAIETGGRAFFPQQVANAAANFANTGDELRSFYTIAYVTARPLDGSFRRIRIDATDKNYETRHPAGYYATP